jgi:hypothetical protein
VPRGCERSLTARSCPAAVHMGALPGPPGSPQGTVDRYAYTDQAHVLNALLRTLPLVRYTTRKRPHVPIGVEVRVGLSISGDTHKQLTLQWSVWRKRASGGELQTWEANRTADIFTPGRSSHVTDFWVPIPSPPHAYLMHLRVRDGNTVLAETHAKFH